MLVDNGVLGDSRVQKTARSAAERGWEVFLLGRALNGPAQEWKLGGATVRLLPMEPVMARRRHEFRRAWLRYPLAYPPNGIAQYRAASLAAWNADLTVKAAQLDIAAREGTPPAALAAARRRLRAARLAWRVQRKWVWLRTGMLNRARSRRKLRNPWDRAYTMFWQRMLKDGAWRRLEPGLWDYERAFAATVDKLDPDLIHANDFRTIGIAARAKIRARARGRDIKIVWDAHEFLPGVKPWQDNGRWQLGNMATEREYAPYADAVMTVSPTLAEMLREAHDLPELPAVVLNAPAPEHGPADGGPVPDLRADCGLAADTPLLVYSGGGAVQRGLDTMVEALPSLPGVHTALVVPHPLRGYVKGLIKRAEELGAGDRLHVLPYVAHWHVVPYLAGADVGVIPIHHWPNHEIALITKFFEYSQGRLPLVVSDVKTMAGTVEATGQGEVFRAEDTSDYVRAVKSVLADPQRYRAAYDTPGLLEAWTWRAQVDVLDDLYRRLVPDGGADRTGEVAS
ncbi:hypothetical protein GCM10010124_00940 [Pilimelia terevasa]|uniref:Glycosyltransferase n=1 Tax=Pilimelia terevasa TaxID=53372 RepID=A0A8J3BCU4_9ACTN|nr:glycosyltransferase family 4 protein [Pilimelia terevasa]GGK12239.1 hypothetical protein GCM10010124_00940 [Pilimelia terevasa]